MLENVRVVHSVTDSLAHWLTLIRASTNSETLGESEAAVMEIRNKAKGIAVMAEAAVMERTRQAEAESKVEIARAKAILAKGLAEAEVSSLSQFGVCCS